MTFRLRHIVITLLVLVGLLVPRVSALALHLHPDIDTVVICAGTELVTLHIGSDGVPIETIESDHGPCVMADPEAAANRPQLAWTQAPRSYRHGFAVITLTARSASERGLLPDLRGPPALV